MKENTIFSVSLSKIQCICEHWCWIIFMITIIIIIIAIDRLICDLSTGRCLMLRFCIRRQSQRARAPLWCYMVPFWYHISWYHKLWYHLLWCSGKRSTTDRGTLLQWYKLWCHYGYGARLYTLNTLYINIWNNTRNQPEHHALWYSGDSGTTTCTTAVRLNHNLKYCKTCTSQSTIVQQWYHRLWYHWTAMVQVIVPLFATF